MMKETSTQRKRRLEKAREKYRLKTLLDHQGKDINRSTKRQKIADRCGETNDLPQISLMDIEAQYNSRLADDNIQLSQHVSNDSEPQQFSRLAADNSSQHVSNVNSLQHLSRLAVDLSQHVSNDIDSQHFPRLAVDNSQLSQHVSNDFNYQHLSRLAVDNLQLSQHVSNDYDSQNLSCIAADDLQLSQYVWNDNNKAEMRKVRLEKQKERQRQLRANESHEKRKARLDLDKKCHADSIEKESIEKRIERLERQNTRQRQLRETESYEQYTARLQREKERRTQNIEMETPEERTARQELDRDRHAQYIENETQQEHNERLHRARQHYSQRSAEAEEFYGVVNTFCDRICDVCLKRCYPNQVVTYRLDTSKPYLPQELIDKCILEVCHRCNTHLRNGRKTNAPPKAYWNNLYPGDIPDEIEALTEVERRLLLRVVPFVKVIKLDGRFGQWSFKGQATLFALDIFQVSEKLPDMLPRASDDASVVVVTETLENLNVSRDWTINRERVFTALRWLIANNPLYKDVTINDSVRLDQNDIVRVVPAAQPQEQNVEHHNNFQSAYKVLNNSRKSGIIRASFNQGNTTVFTEYAGRQCFAMALANIARAAILHPSLWNKDILDENMIAGDGLYAEIRFKTSNGFPGAYHIPQNGFLLLQNLDVIKRDFLLFDDAFSLGYDDNWLCQGNLMDKMNIGELLKTLHNAITELFISHKAGILVAEKKSFGLMKYDEKFYFSDSHSCGPRGIALEDNNDGPACIIECDTIKELHRVIRRTLKPKNDQFSIHYIDVNVKGNLMNMEEYLRQYAPEQQQQQQASLAIEVEQIHEVLSQHMHIQTSLMGPIDAVQPDVEDELVESENVNEIVRKTKDNIVNADHEKKAEEFAWYHLFPYGKNGLNEDRPVRITPLDYYQSRVEGLDTRYQTKEYLFYALSHFEYSRVKSTIAACCKKVQGREGVVEDIHLYLKNLRGSAAYWKTANNELVGQIRCLGPPTWFITLSCNDLNWLDMRKALLLADNRPDVDPSSISLDEAQRLIELYPVVVSRHFMRKVNAFIKFIKHNNEALGGKVKDYWWRIEFQNRGSPHVHMVVWIENAPSFETDEGIKLIDDVVSCHLPSEDEDPELHQLVKKNQMHRHTHTCHKRNAVTCRFGFPRQPSAQTRMVSQTSDEFIRNGGRICTLKRDLNDRYVNNYSPSILKLWNGNMDIQPCGSNEAIAHYIAKYISKSEPTNVNPSIAQAIREIQREETNVSRKLFKVCMRILKERHISACECAFRLCHLPLRGSTRNCVFLNARKPEQRYHVLRFEENRATGVCSSIFDRYVKRPRIHPDFNFKDMCLLEFAMLFEPHYGKRNDITEESVDADVEDDLDSDQPRQRKKLITLTDGSKMVVRNVPAVVRVPFFIMHNDPDNYFYSLLLQYVPHFNENELIDEHNGPREAFLAREAQLKETSSYLETFRERDRQLENAFNQARAFDVLEQPEEFLEAELQEEVLDAGMTDEQFSAACAAMNLKQRELFNMVTRIIQEQMNGGTRRLRLFVTGGAGTGKTFTFKALVNQINRCFGRKAVKVGAPTGIAAKLVSGATLHSLLKLPVEKNGHVSTNIPALSGNFLRVMRQQWREIEFLFIDEISMVSYQTLCNIDSRLRQLKNKEDEPFGGLNVILFGDLMQLPPCQGAQVFQQPESHYPAPHLWRLFSLVELTENMRQQGDTRFADLLNALRVGQLNAQHLDLLKSKMLKEPTGDFAINKAIRIYPTRKLVADFNQAVLDHYRAQGERMFKIRAQDQIVDARNAANVNMETAVPKDINLTGGYSKELEIFVGARVMLRSNIDFEKGLVNGIIGNITEIIWPHFRRDQLYETDIPTVRIDFGRDGIHLIEPRSVQFPANYNQGTIERRMLPIILCWACTVHKMQGCTCDFAVVYLGSKLFAPGQAYVALSRVRSLEGLRIEELNCAKLTDPKGTCNEKAIAEMERMRQYQPPDDDN